MIYFAFSDENGSYAPSPSQRTLNAHPFYVRATVIIEANEWKRLNKLLDDLKERELGFEPSKEVKWAYLWSLKIHERDAKPIEAKDDYFFLRERKSSDVLQFVEKAVGLLASLSHCRIILTLTENKITSYTSEETMMRFHLQELLQRVEMDLQEDSSNLALLFLDPISESTDRVLRNAYSKIFRDGDFIKRYAHVKDSLNFELSHHSGGVQIADFVAGSFSAFLKGYINGGSIFIKHVLPFMRKNDIGEVMGYGLREVPQNHEFRNQLRKLITQGVSSKTLQPLRSFRTR